MEKNRDTRVFAEEIRVETLKEFAHLGFGHVGGAMSIIETLAVLYNGEMRIDPKNPGLETRDKLVLSKGHAGPALYATLALKGYFPLETLMTLNQGGTILPSHCDRLKTPGVDMTTGSLGQGMSTACGLALGDRLMGRDCRTFLILGDGECNEGQVWEGAMFAAHFGLDNLTAFVDLNKQQLDGSTKDVMGMGDMVDKFKSFGWYTQKIDGHNVDEVKEAIKAAKAEKGKPSMIILDTVKGNGCLLAEGMFPCHHIAFTAEQIAPSVEHAEKMLEQARKA
ncbi:MAG: transketolase [Clostridiaceae bacterium]|nr:transketolase [Clostridiaceae bacterium]